jgi:hypothetical protein
VSVLRALATVAGVALFSLHSTNAEATGSVTIRDGLASVTAHDAPVSEVLEAWSRAGGTTIINGEQLSEARLTLELVDVPEAEALDIVLRPAAGYVARKRAAPIALGSTFDRVVILARTVVFPDPEPLTEPSPAREPRQLERREPFDDRLIGPDGLPVPDQDNDDRDTLDSPRDPDEPPSAPPSPAPAAAPFGSSIPGMIVPAPPPVRRVPPQP